MSAEETRAVAVPPGISVIVCTYDRPDALVVCLQSLLAQRTRHPVEIVVVDNHPQSGVTARIAAQFAGIGSILWREEPVPGLSRARNLGIRAARGSVIVATDDDVIAPPEWLELLTTPLFREDDPSLAATAGNCLAVKVTTEAERIFEAYGGLRHGDVGATFDKAWMDQWSFCFPQLWRIGTTANAAFRASVFRDPRVGLFETRLGAGSASGAWEDLYCFDRLLRAGYRIEYLPEAEVRHAHREQMTALTRQLEGYRRGETAFLTLMLFRHGDLRALGQMFWWIPKWRLILLAEELLRRLRGTKRYSLPLFWREAVAYLSGPFALWRSKP